MTQKRFGVITNWCIYENVNGVEKWLTFDKVVELLNELHEENQKLKEDAKQVLFVLACCNRDFGLSVNEAKAIKRLNECVDGSYNINNIKEFLDD